MILTTSLAAANLIGSFTLGCTIFYAYDGETALVGNNEDFFNPDTKVWFVPGRGGEIGEMSFGSGHGRVYFGHTTYPQGGMNDQGLFFDMVSVEPVELLPQEGRPVFKDDRLHCHASCFGVDLLPHLGDSFSAILSPDMDLGFTFITDSSGEANALIISTGGDRTLARRMR